MMKVKVLQDNTNLFANAIKALSGQVVLVGVPSKENARSEAGITNSSLAYIHENGSAKQNIPPRPFLAPGVKSAEKTNIDLLRDTAVAAFKFDSAAVEKGLNKVGLNTQNQVRAQFANNNWPENVTKNRSGKKPLIDTGALRKSITYVIERS